MLGIDPPGEIDANETVHEGRAHSRATQRSSRMRDTVTRTGPAEITEDDFAESDITRADFQTARPERITNTRTGALTAHSPYATNVEVLLNRQVSTGRASAERHRSVEPAEAMG